MARRASPGNSVRPPPPATRIPVENRLARLAEVYRVPGHPRRKVRRSGGRACHPGAGTHFLFFPRRHGDDQLQRPRIGRCERFGVAIGAVQPRAGMHLDEAAENGPGRRPGALARDDAQFPRGQFQVQRSGRGRRQGSVSRRRGRQTGPGGKVVAAGYAGRALHACTGAKQVQATPHPVELFGAAPPVQRQLVRGQRPVKMDFGIRPQRVQRDRNGTYRRNVQRSAVRLAPILDQRDVWRAPWLPPSCGEEAGARVTPGGRPDCPPGPPCASRWPGPPATGANRWRPP